MLRLSANNRAKTFHRPNCADLHKTKIAQHYIIRKFTCRFPLLTVQGNLISRKNRGNNDLKEEVVHEPADKELSL